MGSKDLEESIVWLTTEKKNNGFMALSQCLSNCAPTRPLTQQQSTDSKLGLMLG